MIHPASNLLTRTLFHGGRGLLRWAIGAFAVLVTVLCLLPYLAVVISALTGSTETLTHLAETVLWRYTRDTLVLVVVVMTFSAAIGTGAAWLVTMTDFKGRRWLEIGLALPLAFPAYVLAYGYTHILDHPGIVQSSLRAVMDWGPRDYWFPEIRSLGGAAAVEEVGGLAGAALNKSFRDWVWFGVG